MGKNHTTALANTHYKYSEIDAQTIEGHAKTNTHKQSNNLYSGYTKWMSTAKLLK